MKKYLFLAFVLSSLGAGAATPPDTAGARPPAGPYPKWYRPHHLVLQTGGGLGLVAGGAGYTFGKDRLETDVLVGYVPKRYAGSTLSLASLKFMYSPFRLNLAERVQVLPLTLGAYFSYTHGTINDELKGQYSSDYYWFSTDTRYGPLLGGRITYLSAPVAATGQPRKLAVFYELGSNDLYLLSYLHNRSGGLNFGQVLTLALGLKVDF